MSRDSGGNYQNPVANFTPGTRIDALPMNQKFQDIYDALSASLDRTGKGGMQAPLPLQDGSTAAPSLTFTAEPSLGLYRGGAANARLVATGAVLQEWSLTHVNINRPLTVAPPAGTAATGILALGVLTGTGAIITGGTPTSAVAGGAGVDASGGSGGPGAAGGPGLVATGGSGTFQGLGVSASGGIAGTAAPIDGSGTVRPSRYYSRIANIPAASGGVYPLNGLTWTSANGGNEISMDVYARSTATVTGWEVVRLGFRYDVDGVPGAGGMLEMGSTGASLARGVAATATTPAAALTLTNAYYGFADTVVAPASTTAIKNQLTPPSISKAAAFIKFTSSTAGTVAAGYNVQSIVVNGSQVTINFAQAFKTANYVISGCTFSSTGGDYGYAVRWIPTPATASSIVLAVVSVFQDGGGIIDTRPRLIRNGDMLDISFVGEQ